MESFYEKIIQYLSAAGTAIIAVVVWFNKKMARLEKLERAVFDEDGKERYITAHHCNHQHQELIERMESMGKAIVLMNKAQMRYIHAVIDLMDDGDAKKRLLEVRDELSDNRKIL